MGLVANGCYRTLEEPLCSADFVGLGSMTATLSPTLNGCNRCAAAGSGGRDQA